MEQIGLKFEVITSQAEEVTKQTVPGEMVKELSRLKAEAVFQKLAELESVKNLHMSGKDVLSDKRNSEEFKQTNFAVIGADTIVYYNGQVYGKPENEQRAFDMIQSLAGNVHQVYTGVTILNSDGSVNQFYEKTDVQVFPMNELEIWDYIHTGDPMDKAGSYGIQGPFAAYVKGICGDYNNVVGLPIARLYHELKGVL